MYVFKYVYSYILVHLKLYFTFMHSLYILLNPHLPGLESKEPATTDWRADRGVEIPIFGIFQYPDAKSDFSHHDQSETTRNRILFTHLRRCYFQYIADILISSCLCRGSHYPEQDKANGVYPVVRRCLPARTATYTNTNTTHTLSALVGNQRRVSHVRTCASKSRAFASSPKRAGLPECWPARQGALHA